MLTWQNPSIFLFDDDTENPSIFSFDDDTSHNSKYLSTATAKESGLIIANNKLILNFLLLLKLVQYDKKCKPLLCNYSKVSVIAYWTGQRM